MLTTAIYILVNIFSTLPCSANSFDYIHLFIFLSSCLASLQISHRLFELTNTLKSVFIPTKENRRLLYNFVAGIAISLILYCTALILLQIPHSRVSPEVKWSINEFCGIKFLMFLTCIYWFHNYRPEKARIRGLDRAFTLDIGKRIYSWSKIRTIRKMSADVAFESSVSNNFE